MAPSESTNATGAPRPVCFMVMPFRRRPVEGATGPGAPGELDCDALWDRVFRPVIADLGYLPVRADAETGAVIVKDMLERLAYAHLVLADVSLPNGNVYYEIGLRHVARATGCVLLAASWSRQLFDIEQFRAVRYPLTDGLVPESEAEGIRDLLRQAIPPMASSTTPWHEIVAAPSGLSPAAFREQSEATSRFQARMRSARLAPRDARAGLVQAIVADVGDASLSIPEVAIELLMLVRDEVGWPAVLEFIGRLPTSSRALPFVQEQELLAQAEAGQPFEAIGRLEELIARQGETPERHGLIGGRYKRLWRQARQTRLGTGQASPALDERRYLNHAIDHYTRGMSLDYNRYYCSCNLPPLLRARGKPGDAAQAAVVGHFVVAACERARTRGEQDEWLKPTLLGAAFQAQDVDKAEALAEQIEEEGAAAWKLDTTLSDLRLSAEQAGDEDARRALVAVCDRLAQLTR